MTRLFSDKALARGVSVLSAIGLLLDTADL